MAFTLSPATFDDIAGIIGIWYQVFRSPRMLDAFPDTPVGKAWVAESLKRSMVEESQHTKYMVVTEDGSERKVVSFTKWVLEQGGDDGFSHWTHRWGKDLAEGMEYEKLGPKFFEPMAKQHRAIMKERKHWFLEVLATDPAYERKGAASKMLRWGSEQADKDGVEMYLDASPSGKPLYERFGFVVCTEGNNPEADSTPMLRPLKRTAAETGQ